jgi:hypothetical protein
MPYGQETNLNEPMLMTKSSFDREEAYRYHIHGRIEGPRGCESVMMEDSLGKSEYDFLVPSRPIRKAPSPSKKYGTSD